MRVMTFNLRFENDRDGDNNWQYRREFVVEVIEKLSPSILGTQEGTPGQLAYLEERLPRHRMHCGARPEDPTCQYPTLFYNAEEFAAIEGGELWLSTTPRVHRSKGWDSAFPRMMGYGLFEHLRSGRRLWAIVTHLDHIGSVARLEQAKLIAQWMRVRTNPCVLLGDFNEAPGSPVHRLLTGPEVRLRDTWQVLAKAEDRQSMTHHDFLGVPRDCRMDWVLVGPEFRVLNAAIVREHREDRYPSDHFPYIVELEWD